MFVRFRQSRQRLQASLIDTRRVAGKVVHEHVAGLGSLDASLSVRDRLAFWTKLHERLARLSNRIDGETQAKVLAAVHARIPMVTPDEQRELQLETAQADERIWAFLRDSNVEEVEGHNGLVRHAEQTIAAKQAVIADADAKLAAARDRVARLQRGETVPGGLEEPVNIKKIFKDAGWTKSDFERARLLGAITEAGGEAAFEEMLQESHRRTKRAEDAAVRAVARRMKIA